MPRIVVASAVSTKPTEEALPDIEPDINKQGPMTRKRGRSAVAASSEPADKLQAPSQTLKQLAKGLSRCHEKHYWDKGYDYVVGVDEAGRGPLAGPVVAAACVLPKDVNLDGLNDSKQLDAEQRTILYEKIMKHPDIIWAV